MFALSYACLGRNVEFLPFLLNFNFVMQFGLGVETRCIVVITDIVADVIGRYPELFRRNLSTYRRLL